MTSYLGTDLDGFPVEGLGLFPVASLTVGHPGVEGRVVVGGLEARGRLELPGGLEVASARPSLHQEEAIMEVDPGVSWSQADGLEEPGLGLGVTSFLEKNT